MDAGSFPQSVRFCKGTRKRMKTKPYADTGYTGNFKKPLVRIYKEHQLIRNNPTHRKAKIKSKLSEEQGLMATNITKTFNCIRDQEKAKPLSATPPSKLTR